MDGFCRTNPRDSQEIPRHSQIRPRSNACSQDVVDSTHSGDHAENVRARIQTRPTLIPPYSCRLGLEPDSAQLVAAPRTKQVEPDRNRDTAATISAKSRRSRETRSMSASRATRGVNWSVKSLWHVQVSGDDS